jgi:outer membrane protein assembly factor BamA
MTRGALRWSCSAAIVATCLTLASVANAQTSVGETLGEVRVHGNHTTPDADVLGVAGLTVGAAVSEDLLAQAAARLRASGRFAAVEVRKRYRSLDNPSDILVVVGGDEHAAGWDGVLTPGPR